MMTVQCPSCNKLYNISEAMAGKQVRCKACGMVFAIGAQEQPPQQQQAPEAQMPEDPGRGVAMRVAAGGGGKSVALIGGLAAGVIGLAAVAWFVVIPMFSGGQPGWTKPLMPKGTKLVLYIDVESIRESELFGKLSEMVREQTGEDMDKAFQKLLAEKGLKSKLTLDDVQGVFLAGSDMEGGGPGRPPKMVIGVRLTRSMALGEVISGVGVEKKKYKDFDYVIAGPAGEKMHLAQIDDKTFCAAPAEALMKQALDRVDSGESVELDDDLASILSTVSRKDSFLAGNFDALPPIPFLPLGLKGFGVGLEINGSFGGVAIVDFKDASLAEKLAKQTEEGLEKARKDARKSIEQLEEMIDKASGSRKEEMEKQLDMMETVAGWLDDVDVSQSGSQVEFTASIDTDELVEIFDQVKGMVGGLMPTRR